MKASFLCAFFASLLTTSAGILDLTAAVRTDGSDPTIVDSTGAALVGHPFQAGAAGWTLRQKGLWVDYVFPETWHAGEAVYATGFYVQPNQWDYRYNQVTVYGSVDGSGNWVQLADITKEQHFEAITHRLATIGNYRAYRFVFDETYPNTTSCKIDYIKIYGTVGEPVPYGALIVQASGLDGLEVEETAFSPSLGEHATIPSYPTEAFNAMAPGSITDGDDSYVFSGYTREESTDGGETWVAQALGASPLYAYSSRALVQERITWNYVKSTVLAGDLYVDPIAGSDSNNGARATPLQTLTYALLYATDGHAVNLAAGTYVLDAEIALSLRHGIRLVGAGAGATFIQPTTGVSTRHFNLLECQNLEFSGITFRDGSVQATTGRPAGGSFYMKDCDGIRFTDCAFEGNTVGRQGTEPSYGGAIYALNTSFHINRCQFDRNEAHSSNQSARGGAIAAHGYYNTRRNAFSCSNSVFTANVVNGRKAGDNWSSSLPGSIGAALYAGTSMRSDISECFAAHNSALSSDHFGTGVFAFNINPKQPYEQFHNNGGAYPHCQADATVAHCSFFHNFVDAAVAEQECNLAVDGCLFVGQPYAATRITTSRSLHLTNGFVDGELRFTKTATLSSTTGTTQGDAALALDLTLPASSAAAGYGTQLASPYAGTIAPRTLAIDPAGNAAYTTLTAALAEARDGDTLRLAPGAYSAETYPIRIDGFRHLTLLGAGPEQTFFESPAGQDVNTSALLITNCHNTVIGGFSLQNFTNRANDITPSALTVHTGAGLTLRDIVISGCTKRPAAQKSNLTAHSGGHFSVAAVRDFVMECCTIRDCHTEVNNGTFTHPVAYFGLCVGRLDRCAFRDNTANIRNPTSESIGFGIIHADANLIAAAWDVRNCLIANNRNTYASYTGNKGIAYTSVSTHSNFGRSTPNFENCTFVGSHNTPITASAKPFYAQNCIFANCGSVINSTKAADRALFHCLIEQNDAIDPADFPLATASFTDTLGNAKGIPENVVFVAEAGFVNRTAGNYALSNGSAAFDLGATLPWMDRTTSLDLAGNARITSASPDAGAYEVASIATLLYLR